MTPYSIIRAGDRITVNAQTAATVVAVRKYTQLTSVLQTEDLSLLLPLSAASSVSAIAAGQRHFRQFISVAEEEQHGLVVFQLAVAAPIAPATAQAAGGDWSSACFFAIAAYLVVVADIVALWPERIYDHLSAKRDAGCSMADLRFAFPTLPVQQISDVLVDVSLVLMESGHEIAWLTIHRRATALAAANGRRRLYCAG